MINIILKQIPDNNMNLFIKTIKEELMKERHCSTCGIKFSKKIRGYVDIFLPYKPSANGKFRVTAGVFCNKCLKALHNETEDDRR